MNEPTPFWKKYDLAVSLVSLILSIISRQIFLIIPSIIFLIYVLSGGNPYKKLSIFNSSSGSKK
jgi:hypothetical protein